MKEKRERHILETIYIVIVLSAIACSCIYTVLNHPVRQLLTVRVKQEKIEARKLEDLRKNKKINAKPPSPTKLLLARVRLAWHYIWPDIVMASFVYAIFFACGYFFLRKFITWLMLERSGEMATIRSRGLEAKAIEANKFRKKPIE